MTAESSSALRQCPRHERLTERIREHGPITVEAFMQACLTGEGGYYRARQPIGAEGDFITAPEISQIFGELIGAWAAVVWEQMGAPERVELVELGPGRGTLVADALRVAELRPRFCGALRLSLIEQSEALRDVQRSKLGEVSVPIDWRGSLEEVPLGPCIVIANEFLDALAVRQFVRTEEGWRERCVGLGPDGSFRFVLSAEAANPEIALDPGLRRGDAAEGDILETRPGADTLLDMLAARARKAPLAALFFDYGYTEGSGDTLQAVRRHEYADPLATAGEADLTAHVDFEALLSGAQARGLKTFGPVTQREFLLRLGLMERLERLSANAEPARLLALRAGALRLVAEDQMGLLFKACAVTSGKLPPPPPWDSA